MCRIFFSGEVSPGIGAYKYEGIPGFKNQMALEFARVAREVTFRLPVSLKQYLDVVKYVVKGFTSDVDACIAPSGIPSNNPVEIFTHLHLTTDKMLKV